MDVPKIQDCYSKFVMIEVVLFTKGLGNKDKYLWFDSSGSGLGLSKGMNNDETGCEV